MRKTAILGALILLMVCIANADPEVVVTVEKAYTTASLGYLGQPDSGYKFLVLDLEMMNNGYSQFYVNPNYLKLVLNNGHYGYDWHTYNIKDVGYPPMSSCTIEDGETLDTAIAFQVPASSSSANNWDLRWQDWSGDNVRFVL